MYFLFITSEVKYSAVTLNAADQQNAYSITVLVRAFVELFRLVKRKKELDRKIVGFSFSYNPFTARIYAYYAAINRPKTTFYRYTIRKFNFTKLGGKEKWVAYKITKGIYDYGKHNLLSMICSAID